MHIIFVGRTCSNYEYERVKSLYSLDEFSPSQIMFHSLLKGLANTDGTNVTCIGARMVNPKNTKGKGRVLKKSSDIEDNVKYIYPTMLYLPRLSSVWAQIVVFMQTLHLCILRGKKDTVVICDILQMCANTARIASRLVGIPTIGYATDLPNFMSEIRITNLSPLSRLLSKMREKQLTKSMVHYDGYVVLVEEMNKYINPKNRPNIVVECIVDDCKDINSTNADITSGKKIMYAGSTNFSFGIGTLLDGFGLIDKPDAELHIYGSGDYTEEIIKRSVIDTRIQYHGIVSNKEVKNAERSADILVNPRPTKYSFTKVSFPSKIAEYMSSGKPVLTTHLAGIPAEYDKYLWYIYDETADGVAKCIVDVLSLAEDERFMKSMAAQKFILENKNSYAQGKAIVQFLKEQFHLSK